jgi:hypothetical protein
MLKLFELKKHDTKSNKEKWAICDWIYWIAWDGGVSKLYTYR